MADRAGLIRATVLAALLALTACAPVLTSRDRAVALAALTAQLAGMRHECVPLGWSPVVAGPTYYPGYTAHSLGADWWLPPQWAVSIANARLKNADVAGVAAVLNDLVSKKLLSRQPYRGGSAYYLTLRAFPYFYASDDYGDNAEGWPYLCYSTVRPTHVRWMQQPHTELVSGKPHPVYRVEFDWSASARADWADDEIIRSHSVILAPVSTPAVAKLVEWDGDWQVARVYAPGFMLPALSRVAGNR